MAMMGLEKSSSFMPVARHSARAPAILRPEVDVFERYAGMLFTLCAWPQGTFCFADIGNRDLSDCVAPIRRNQSNSKADVLSRRGSSPQNGQSSRKDSTKPHSFEASKITKGLYCHARRIPLVFFHKRLTFFEKVKIQRQ